MKLVKFEKDWADEMYAEGFRVFTDEEWAAYEKRAEQATGFYFYFGTNEGWDEGDEDPQDVLEYDFKVVDVTDADVTVLTTLFPGGYFGQFPDADCFTNSNDE